jgi:hypothetical protein
VRTVLSACRRARVLEFPLSQQAIAGSVAVRKLSAE